MEWQRNVAGRLPTRGWDYTARVLDVVGVQNCLDADALKVQTNRLIVAFADRPDRSHRAPIKLDQRADTVHTGSENDDTAVVQGDAVLDDIVGRV